MSASDMTRRHFLKAGSLTLGACMAGGIMPAAAAAAEDKATVFFTRDLSAAGLCRIYERVASALSGKVAVKLHTGEPKGPNILPREWVKALLPHVPQPTIVECNVLYLSPRQTTEGHRETLRINGWDFCPVDIMDAEGDAMLPVKGGKHLKELAVGKHLLDYDSLLVLTHFKGHIMGGFGGSLKNIAIGCASGETGKEQLHREGEQLWAGGPRFMERMVEGGKALVD
uniref:DUF362 domain-containing protein n=1 Tax=uncultured Desulfovibrio sp. TaxID=167968 RepID=UPI00261178FB